MLLSIRFIVETEAEVAVGAEVVDLVVGVEEETEAVVVVEAVAEDDEITWTIMIRRTGTTMITRPAGCHPIHTTTDTTKTTTGESSLNALFMYM